MVRRRYYYRRTSRPKQKWAINAVSSNVFASSGFTVPAGEKGSVGTIVCTNSTRIEASGSSLVSSAQILKTGRWKFRGVIVNPSAGISYIFYLVYVPEGYYTGEEDLLVVNEGTDIFFRHPEWVLAWTRRDYTSADQGNEVSLTSRLKRNLNSGDQIQMRVLLYNNSTSTITVGSNTPIIRGTASYCCRAN